MVRVDFDQPTYLRAARGLAILSTRLNHLLPEEEQPMEFKAAEPVVINRLYRGVAPAVTPLEQDADEVVGELIPYNTEAQTSSEVSDEEAPELNFGGIEGKSVTGVYAGSGFNHYRFNKKNGKSFFLRVGKHLIWGIELHPALRNSGAVQGQKIRVTFLGKKPVTVLKKGSGDLEEWVDAHKNFWKITTLN